jgi:outer membrane receptor protein involved in Fe transport
MRTRPRAVAFKNKSQRLRTRPGDHEIRVPGIANRQLKTLLRAAVICALGAAAATTTPALAHAGNGNGVSYKFNITSVALPQALRTFALISGQEIIFTEDFFEGKNPVTLQGDYTPEDALRKLLQGTGLIYERSPSGAIMIKRPGATALWPPANDSLDSRSAFQQRARTDASGQSDNVVRYAQAEMQSAGQSDSSTQRAKKAAEAPDPLQGILEEILVTAQRREERLDRVPISVTSLSQKMMDDFHVQSFADLAGIVPGLVVTTPTGTHGGSFQSSTDVAIRGIYSNGNAPTTGIYIDETLITTRQNLAAGYSGSPQPDIFDLDRVEVLRGPQGTLFGSSAMGGIIRYITPEPDTQGSSSWYGKAEAGFTDQGTPSYAAGVAWGAPIVEGKAGLRLSGWFHSDGGFIDIQDPFTGETRRRDANSSRGYVLRPAVTLTPTEGLTITPAVFIQHQESEEPDVYWTSLLPNPKPGRYVSGYGATVHQPVKEDFMVSSLTIKYDAQAVSFQSDTSYLDRDYYAYDDLSTFVGAFFGLPPVVPSLSGFYSYDKNIVWGKAWQQEFRFSSVDDGSRFNWVAGVYYRHALDGISQLLAPDLSPLTQLLLGEDSIDVFGVPNYVIDGVEYNSYTKFTTVTEQEAVFGEGSFDIVPRFKASVGVRVERSSVIKQRNIFAGPLVGAEYADVKLPDQKETPVTPRVSLTYQYTDDDMVYATAAKGYRAGGSNSPVATDNPSCDASMIALGLSSVPLTYDSDSLWSYEIGAKNSLFDRRLALQASAFFVDWSDIQTQVNLSSCGQNFTANRGRAISRGFDLQLTAAPLPGLKVSANVGYNDAYYPDARHGTPRSNGTVPVLTESGDKLAFIPPWSASARAEYSRDISSLWPQTESYLRVDYRWVDAFPRSNPNVSGYDPGPNGILAVRNHEYGLLNLRVGVLHQGIELSAFVDNATNARPLIGLAHANRGDPLVSAVAVRPRTVGVTALYRF